MWHVYLSREHAYWDFGDGLKTRGQFAWSDRAFNRGQECDKFSSTMPATSASGENVSQENH